MDFGVYIWRINVFSYFSMLGEVVVEYFYYSYLLR